MLKTNNQIRVTQQGDKLTARAGNPLRQRAPGVVAPRSQEKANMYTFGSGGGNKLNERERTATRRIAVRYNALGATCGFTWPM